MSTLPYTIWFWNAVLCTYASRTFPHESFFPTSAVISWFMTILYLGDREGS